MRRSLVPFAGGLPVGLLLAGGLYWLVGDFIFASATGVVWASGVALGIHIYGSYPSVGAEPTWERNRWVAFSTGSAALAALLGVSPTLPISAELRLGLGVLVIGTGFVAMVTSALAELERFDVSSDR